MLLYSPTLAAQEKKTTIEEEKVPFYQGTTIGVDIFGLGSKIFGGDITSTEISVEVNLKNRYVPVAEIGYGTLLMMVPIYIIKPQLLISA